ncbi:hybrid sensor histidine kinase/response regulator [Aureibaculum marinum]|uniref:histidine kinase n=1 Tax=Aureibaculum marinum TaxID=2487930 RepID=A0A3N4NAL4_9FLAO|nr:two-component regulator propeller domain-containing protein [Aureibaculum marinum]RPD93374.1 hybrid sensor histidine kinase/response regulator [Aureibaculum marinum]
MARYIRYINYLLKSDFTTIVFLLCWIVSSGQITDSIGTRIKFNHLNVANGLSQSTVLSIHQDTYGFMWIGTRNGLNLYDTNSFKIFRPTAGDSSSIAGHVIYDIAEDANNNIWIATQNGLSKYDRSLNTFNNYQLFPKATKTIPASTIFIDKNNRIWVGGNFGLLTFDPKNKTFYYPEINNNIPKNINVSSIQEDTDGNLWIGAENFSVYRFHQKTNNWHQLEIKTPTPINSRIEALKIEKNVGLWLGTYGSGLIKIDFSGNLLEHYHQKASGKNIISNDNIRALEFDEKNNLWIGTFNGLNIVDQNGYSKIINYQENNFQGLSHSSIRSLFKDEKGSIWIGTYFGGLNIYDKDNQRFKHFYHIEGDKNSLSFNVIGAFSEDSDGNIYIGTERGGLNILNRKKYTHKKPPTGYDDLTIKSLFHDRNKQLWLGVFKKGLNLYNPINGHLTQYPINQPNYNFLKSTIINDIQQDFKENLWLATDAEGIYKFNLKNKTFIDYPHQKILTERLRYVPVKSIVILKDQQLALATRGQGLIFFNSKTGSIIQKKNFTVKNKDINIEEFNHVYADKNNNLWLSSNGTGLIKYNLNNNKISHFDIKKGLSNNVVQGIMEDADSNIWAITLNGLTKIDIVSDSIVKNYTYASGIPLNEINEGAFYKTINNEFLIGGNNGYIKFNPTSLQNNNYIPKMAFTGIEVMNKAVSPQDDSGVLEKELNKTEKITLSHSQSILTLEFVALSYLKAENNHYKYKLEGFDLDWVYTKDRPRVTYTNLRKGDYTFYAKGSNNDGIWNETPLKLMITVKPPPWQTWWAYIIYTLLIIGGFYIVRSNGIRSAKLKHSLKIEQIEKERWKDVHDLKLKHFMDVSHEFRTPLSLISAPLEEILKEKKIKPKVKSLAKTMDLNVKRLQLLIDQILELRALETGHSKLNLQPINLTMHIEEIINSFKTLADKNNIKLVLNNNSTNDKLVMVDQEKLNKIFFNLIYNAFKFTPSGGEISLIIDSTTTQNHISYTFILKDTGIGIEPEFLPYIFDRFKKKNQMGSGTGIGLALTKSIVEIMKGTIEATSTLGNGTTFTLHLNLNKAITENQVVETTSYALPFPIEQEVLTTQIIDEESTSEKAQILIVEDNLELQNYLNDKLKKNYIIRSASNGKKGLKKAKKYGPDLIISDVMMPEMDGLELCKAIKSDKALCHIPVLLLTAKVSKMNKMEGLETGADAYLAKPFSLEELQIRIKNVLKNQALLQQKYQKLSTPYLKEEKLLNPQDEKLMTAILKVITDNLDQPNFTVEFLGTEAGLSRVHLYRKLKSLTGMNPSEFIRDIRMKNACKLLETQQYKPSDVAYMVGFQDTKYFSICFKKHTGMSPSKYINSKKLKV